MRLKNPLKMVGAQGIEPWTNPFLGQWNQAMKRRCFKMNREYSVNSKRLPNFSVQNARIRGLCPLVIPCPTRGGRAVAVA
jgi:hypothetical protein